MELQELVERIQRWRLRQSGAEPVETVPHTYQEVPQAEHAAPYEEAATAEVGEEQISELDVEPDAMMPEEATSEVNLEQIEEVD